MTSTPWHQARPARASLLLGALALLLAVPGGAAHVACEHAHEMPPGGHHCAICRHLADATPLIPEAPVITAPVVIDAAAVPNPFIGMPN